MDATSILSKIGERIGLGSFAWPVSPEGLGFCSDQARKILVGDVRHAHGLLPLLSDGCATRFQEAISAKADFTLDLLLRNARWIELRAVYDATTDGEHMWLGTVADITYRVVDGAAGADTGDVYRSMADNSPAMLWMGDATGKCIFLNAALRDFWGVNPQDLSTFDWAATTHPDDIEVLARPFMAAMEAKTPFTVEARYRRADGEWRTMRTDARPRFDPRDGSFLGMSGVNTDITPRLEAERRESEGRRLRDAIMQVSPDAIVTMDAEGHFVDVNAGFERVFGFARADVLGQSVNQHIVPPGLRDRHRDGLQRYLKTGEPTILNQLIELTALHADGREIPVDIAVARITDSDPPLFTAFLRDISARKAAEAHTRMLMGELNHRTKNILTLVQAVARQSARHAEPQAFIREFGERLKGLAVSNDLLVKTDWAGVAIHDLLDMHLAHLRDLVGTRIHLDGPDIQLDPKRAQTLGMAIHELSTNSLKYGALAHPGARVEVAWSATPSEVGSLSSMHWRESGLEGVVSPERKGFGHFVLVDMVSMVMGCDVALEYRDDGLVWSIRARDGAQT